MSPDADRMFVAYTTNRWLSREEAKQTESYRLQAKIQETRNRQDGLLSRV